MANSIDTFQLYIESLDSSSTPKGPAEVHPPPPSQPDDSFDTSYVDKVIFGGGTSGHQDENIFGDFTDNAAAASGLVHSQVSFKSDEVTEIDSGLSSPEYGASGNVGSFQRPDFLKLNSFMIWNDPDLKQQQQQTPSSPSKLEDSSASSQNQDHSGLSTPADGNSKSADPNSSSLGTSPSASMNIKTMKKRGLFSRSTAGTAGGLANNELDTSLGAEKSPKSPGSSSSGNLNNSSTSVGAGGINGEADEDRFNGEGVQFHGKLIGSEYVAEARGEQMCQQSLKKLKIIQKAMGGHKRRIHLYISFDGIKIQDALTSEQLFHHTVPQISFISRDETDTRAFGYVFGNSTTGHQFIGIKTKKEAMVVMTTIGQLFAITLKRKRSAEEAAALAAAAAASVSDHHLTASSTSGGLIDTAADDSHLYHSVYDIESGGSSLRPGSTRNRSRTASQNSEHTNNVIIPALPPPTGDHHRRGHSGHGLTALGGGGSGFHQQPQTVKLCPPANNNSNTLFNEMDVFGGAGTGGGSFDPHSAPVGGVNHIEKTNKHSSSSFDWANFDDDQANISSAAGGGGTNSIGLDDSTLHTISSISDVNASALSMASKTLSQDGAGGGGGQTTTSSATLVARYNQKNHPKNSSSSTIASTNFDGADPFSDAFGADDPFSGSLAVGGGELSGSLGGKPNESTPIPILSNQLGSLHLDKSSGSFKSNTNLELNSSYKSVDSTSSADRYAALADIHNLSNSIFDSFGNRKPQPERKGSPADHRAGSGGGGFFSSSQSATVAMPPVATTATSNLFASGSAFQQPISTATNVAMYVQPAMYQSSMPTNASPYPGQMMMTPATTSQMYYNPAATVAMPISTGQNSLSHSAQWTSSTSSLPTAFGVVDPSAGGSAYMPLGPGGPGFVPSNPMVAGGGAGAMLRNPMQSSSTSLFTPPPIAAQSFSSSSAATSASNALNASNGSINNLPLFQDLDPLGKNKASFPLKQQDPMFQQQQQSMDSYTRNCSTPSSVHAYPSQSRSPLLPGQRSLPSSSVGTSSPEPSFPPPSLSPRSTTGVSAPPLPESSAPAPAVSTSSQPVQATVSHQSSFTSQWSISSSIPSSAAYGTEGQLQHPTTSSEVMLSPPIQSSESSDPTTVVSRPEDGSEKARSKTPDGPTASATSALTPGTNTITTTTTASATSSISSSSISSSLQNVSSELLQSSGNVASTTAASSSNNKFETTFDDVFEPEEGRETTEAHMPKQDSSEQILLQPDEDEEKEVGGGGGLSKEDEPVQQRKPLSTKASITSYDSLVSESIKSSDLVPSTKTTTNRPTLSRQSSTSSSTRDRGSGTPPAIPPRTDLQSTHSNPGSATKYRFPPGSNSSTPPPPLPPPNRVPSSTSSYPQSAILPPYYPPPYGASAYGPYGPPPEMYPGDSRRYHRYPPPPPPPPNPWGHASSGHYEYLYPHHEHHHSPYYSTRIPIETAAGYPPPHAYAPPPPPPHAYDPYASYRQSPYFTHQSSPYSSSPAPPPTSEGYSSEYHHYQHPPPPVPTSHFSHLKGGGGHSSNSSTPPLEGTTPPPTSSSGGGSSGGPPALPLPNPQRRISSSSMIERGHYSSGPGGYFGTLGRSNSSASALTTASDQHASSSSRSGGSTNPGIPNYPPPPPPTGAAPPYYGALHHHHHHAYYGPEMALPPSHYDYATSGNSSESPYEPFYDVPRRKEAEYSVPGNNQALPANSIMAFNANMEQMIMKYHSGSDGPQEKPFGGYGPPPSGSPFSGYPAPGLPPPKRYPYPSPLAPPTAAELPASGCNSSNSSSGSSGYSTSRLTPKNPGVAASFGYSNVPSPFSPFGGYPGGGPSPLYGGQPTELATVAKPEQQPWTTTSDTSSKMPAAASLFDDNFGDGSPFDWSKGTEPEKTEPSEEKETSPESSTRTTDDNNNSNDTVAEDDSNGSSTLQGDSNSDELLKKVAVAAEPAKVNSPPERSIFATKEDPFDDDFFKS